VSTSPRVPSLLVTAFVFALAFAPACGPSERPPAPPPSPQMAPTPYTAEEIHETARMGRRYEWNVERPGKPRQVSVLMFVKVTKGGAELETSTLDETGHLASDVARDRSTWSELRDHASFPAASATIAEETITVPAGTYPCKVYVVTEGKRVSRFWFATKLPGPPVKIQITEDATVVESRELFRLTNLD
jgi:hypothetical protein